MTKRVSSVQVSETYHRLKEQMAAPSVKESLPQSWQQLINIKEVYYTALSHHHFGVGQCCQIPE